MKLAIPINKSNQVDEHFGHCEMYKVVTLNENNEIAETELVDSPKGCGCKSDIADTLSGKGVTIMLAGGIGDGAVNKLSHSGIEVIRGCSGDVDKLAVLFTEGKIADAGSNCSHHSHQGEHGHSKGTCDYN